MIDKKKNSLEKWSKYALKLPFIVLIFLCAYACNSKKDKDHVKGLAPIGQSETTSTNRTMADKNATPPPPLKSTVVFTPRSKDYEGGSEAVFEGVDQMPQFPGGQEALSKFISDNLNYPKTASDKGIEGRVTVRFIVLRNGRVSNVEVLGSLNPACDKEAVRVVKMMPKWTPGKEQGEDVSVFYTLPILYQL